MKADAYAYRDRRNRKRDFRRLWITRINAAARQNGMSYAHVHARPEAGRHRARPQGPGRHRRARPRDLPPIRRERPRGVGGLSPADTAEPSQGAPPIRSGALFRFANDRSPAPTTSRSRRSASSPGRSGATSCAQFVAEGEDLLDGRRRGRLGAARALVAEGSRAGGRARSRRTCSPQVSQLGSGTRALGVYGAALGARAGRAAVRRAVGRQRPRQRRHGAARARSRSAPRASRSAPAAPTRTAPRPCGRRWARCSRCPVARVRDVSELPGRTVALVAREGAPLRELPSGDGRRSWSAPSARGCPRTWSRRATRSPTSRSPPSR